MKFDNKKAMARRNLAKNKIKNATGTAQKLVAVIEYLGLEEKG